MELTEINAYARDHFNILINWYIFFLTVNFTVIGWFTSLLFTSELKVSQPIIFITVFFLVQILLSYLACLEARKYFVATHNRCNEILGSWQDYPGAAALPAKPAIPIDLYHKIIGLMCQTFVSFALFWVALLGVTLYLVPLG